MPLLISGIVSLIVGLVLLRFWGWHLLAIIKALLPLAVLGVGAVLTYLGYEEYRENSRAAKSAAKALNLGTEPVPGGAPAMDSPGPIIEVSPDGEASFPAENAPESGGPAADNPDNPEDKANNTEPA